MRMRERTGLGAEVRKDRQAKAMMTVGAYVLLAVSLLSIVNGRHGRTYQAFKNPPSSDPSPPSYDTHYLSQQLDHFNYANHVKWNQKYLISDAYWSGAGPMLFYSGNEGPIEEFYANTGFLFTLAQHFNALIVFAEHRYYGESLPFGKSSFSSSNLGYLSVEQTLADFAVLIETLKTDMNGISKVITLGGSYGGMLSAWLRMKYPNVVDGALAGSAPILFLDTDNTVPRTAFFQKVTKDFADVAEDCPEYVREGFSKIEQLAATPAGLAELTKSFSLCKPLTSDKVEHLKGWVRNSFTSLAMVDYPYPASFLAPLPGYPVKVSCQIILNANDRLTGLAQGAGLFYNGTAGNLSCFDIEAEYVDCADPTGCGTGNEAISWDYQVCTELGLATDTNNVTDMFPPFRDDHTQYCYDKYQVSPRPGWMSAQYWGSDLRQASNIIFSNGNVDPWSVGGVTPEMKVPDSVTAVWIEGGAHHLDLRFADAKDPPAVVTAREKERDIIAQWINS